MQKQKIALIIGAGPAGLTAAYELLKHTNIKPVVVEMTGDIGGISKTVNYKGNLIDIGGHRFFSKSDVVMNWWQEIMPIENTQDDFTISYQNKTKLIQPKPSKSATDFLLVRNRVSRIFFLKKLFNYPLKLNLDTFKKLGFLLTIKIGISYVFRLCFPIKKENSLEDFFINRFGEKLYLLLFKDYTEKVWGAPCSEISAEWGRQRIKKLSILKAIKHSIKKPKKNAEISQKDVETTLIEKFLYPQKGPGQLWEKVAKIIIENGGEIHHYSRVATIHHENAKITSASCKLKDGIEKTIELDYIISTMPIKYLIKGLTPVAPQKIKTISDGLIYRDFITVGLLVDKIKIEDGKVNDNWIYIQDKTVKLGRLQIFNNWSPSMVKDPSKIWLGLEYFCNQGDELWEMEDTAFMKLAIKELDAIGIINSNDVVDQTIIRMPKAYPAYFGSYDQFDQIRNYVDEFENLFLVGRNGMHKYNNQDHSMLTAITAVQNIINNSKDKSNLWKINTEDEYHEGKSK